MPIVEFQAMDIHSYIYKIRKTSIYNLWPSLQENLIVKKWSRYVVTVMSSKNISDFEALGWKVHNRYILDTGHSRWIWLLFIPLLFIMWWIAICTIRIRIKRTPLCRETTLMPRRKPRPSPVSWMITRMPWRIGRRGDEVSDEEDDAFCSPF